MISQMIFEPLMPLPPSELHAYDDGHGRKRAPAYKVEQFFQCLHFLLLQLDDYLLIQSRHFLLIHNKTAQLAMMTASQKQSTATSC
jgi:hypothetical protein